MDNQVLIALVGVIYILGETIKFKSQKKQNGKQNGYFTSKDRQMLHELFRLHSPTDADGVPLWYMPRRLLEIQSLTNEKLESVVSELKQVNLEKWECSYRKQGQCVHHKEIK